MSTLFLALLGSLINPFIFVPSLMLGMRFHAAPLRAAVLGTGLSLALVLADYAVHGLDPAFILPVVILTVAASLPWDWLGVRLGAWRATRRSARP